VTPSWARHVRVGDTRVMNPQRVARSAVSGCRAAAHAVNLSPWVLGARRGQLRAPSRRAASRWTTHCAITKTGATALSVQPNRRPVNRLSARQTGPRIQSPRETAQLMVRKSICMAMTGFSQR
jgi:hypothetical protein